MGIGGGSHGLHGGEMPHVEKNGGLRPACPRRDNDRRDNNRRDDRHNAPRKPRFEDTDNEPKNNEPDVF